MFITKDSKRDSIVNIEILEKRSFFLEDTIEGRQTYFLIKAEIAFALITYSLASKKYMFFSLIILFFLRSNMYSMLNLSSLDTFLDTLEFTKRRKQFARSV